MDLREIGYGGVDWIHPLQDKIGLWSLVNTEGLMNLFIKGGNIFDQRGEC
jgi:hypothetical protein